MGLKKSIKELIKFSNTAAAKKFAKKQISDKAKELQAKVDKSEAITKKIVKDNKVEATKKKMYPERTVAVKRKPKLTKAETKAFLKQAKEDAPYKGMSPFEKKMAKRYGDKYPELKKAVANKRKLQPKLPGYSDQGGGYVDYADTAMKKFGNLYPGSHRMKKGGTVKKCRMDGIALRGKTRAKERSK